MSNTKKNAGCSNCKHYERDGTLYGGGYELCNSGLTIKNGKVNNYRDGFVQVEHGYSPKRENKNLTCKGFTPIDWKAKYEAVKEKKVDMDIYVSQDDYDKVCDDNDRLEKTIRNLQIWFICVSLVLVAVSLSLIFLR